MRVALVHDWLTGMRGGERVLHELAGMFPDADLHTLFFVPGSTSERIESLAIEASVLSRLPGAARHYRKLLPLLPLAIEAKRLSDYDLVLSTSHAVAKGVRVAPGTPHLSYCFTPMRYVWDQADVYLGRGLKRALAAPLVAYLRAFDLRTSRPDRVTRFTACSQNVANRIRRIYDREAEVVYPPVAVDRFRPNGKEPENFFLVVGGFVAYKREDVAVEAFRELGTGYRLVVAGDGPARRRLEARAPANVEFVGRVDDAELADLYASCRALLFPGDEDFGMIPVEVQAAGRPVIAFGRGGALETVLGVVEGRTVAESTGLWFEPQTPAAAANAVREFERVERAFDPATLRAHAMRFAPQCFREGIDREIAATLHRS